MAHDITLRRMEIVNLNGMFGSVVNEPIGSQSARSRASAVSHSQSNSTSQSEKLGNRVGLHPDCVIYMVLRLVIAGRKLPEKGRRRGQDLALFSSQSFLIITTSFTPPPDLR
jgi:hypothetical protein